MATKREIKQRQPNVAQDIGRWFQSTFGDSAHQAATEQMENDSAAIRGRRAYRQAKKERQKTK